MKSRKPGRSRETLEPTKGLKDPLKFRYLWRPREGCASAGAAGWLQYMPMGRRCDEIVAGVVVARPPRPRPPSKALPAVVDVAVATAASCVAAVATAPLTSDIRSVLTLPALRVGHVHRSSALAHHVHEELRPGEPADLRRAESLVEAGAAAACWAAFFFGSNLSEDRRSSFSRGTLDSCCWNSRFYRDKVGGDWRIDCGGRVNTEEYRIAVERISLERIVCYNFYSIDWRVLGNASDSGVLRI